MALIWLLVALLAAALWALQWRWRRRRLEKMAACIPGPRPWPIVGNALQLGTSSEDVYSTIFNLFQTYGSIFRFWIGPTLLVLLHDPNDYEMLLSSSRYIHRGRLFDFFRIGLGQGLLTSSGEKWRTHRKILTPTFHFKVLEHFLEIIDRKTSVLIDQLKKKDNGQSFDVHHYMTSYALDVLQETAMGLDASAQTDTESTYSKAVKDATDTLWKRIVSPWLYPDVIFKLSSVSVKQKKALNIMNDTTRNIIQTKMKDKAITENGMTDGGNGARSSKRPKAFLDLLLQEKVTGGTFTDQDIQDEVTTFLAAGHETSASALSFTLWLLSTHPDIQDKVYNEVKLLLSKTSQSSIKTFKEMKYLEAVIKEGLRLFPPIPLIIREIHEDFIIKDGITIPAGANVIMPILFVHKNPQFYAEPEAFIPERFLDKESNSRHSFAFVPFSAGPRNCIGQKFAMLSLKASISKILLHYKLLPDVEFKPRLTAHIVMKSSNGIKMKICKREIADS